MSEKVRVVMTESDMLGRMAFNLFEEPSIHIEIDCPNGMEEQAFDALNLQLVARDGTKLTIEFV